MIKEEFLEVLKKYTSQEEQQQKMWEEVEQHYSQPDRHYHTLHHLNAMLAELQPHKDTFSSWDTVIFALAYHDLVYNSLKSNNEEKSAEVAIKRLQEISFPKKLLTLCEQFILATKKHEAKDLETNLFTDADLSILGADSQTYEEYSKQIRREYSIYPDILYNPGRKKVLLHFLEMPNIYKTLEFRNKYERQAKSNMQAELMKL